MKTTTHFLICGMATIGFFVSSCSSSEVRTEPKKQVAHKESPDEPYEEFMLQRTYPNATFEINTYRNALNAAATQASTQRSENQVSWVLEGPGNIGGRFNCICVDPNNSNIMYAGSANGGVWKTTNNAASWAPITDVLPYQAIGAIAINPNNSNEIWVGTGDLNISGTLYTGNGVYKSTDAGITWNYLGLSNTYVVSSIIFNPNNTNEVLISTMGNVFNRDNNRGIYKTTDAGATFTNKLFVNDSTGVIDMIQNPTTPSTVFASSFTRMRTDRVSLLQGTEVYVYKSTDFGQTWQQLAGGLPNGNVHERLGIALCKTVPNTMYALYSTSDGSNPELYKSTNGGTSWSNVAIGSFDNSAYGSFGWYFGKIYVDPNNANKLYIPGVDLQSSSNGGVDWILQTPPWWQYIVHADGHYIHFNSSSDMIYCTDGGLYQTTDGGANWNDIENIPNNQFYAVTENPNVFGEYAGGVQDNGTMFGNASVINNYTRIYGGDGFTVQYVPGNPQLIYSESQYGNIVFDDAAPSGNWQGLNMDFNQTYNWHTPYFISPQNSSILFYGGQNVNKITNAPYGSSTVISPSLVDPASPTRVKYVTTIHQSVLNANVLYAGTADGKVWNTLNGGTTWTDITPFQGNQFYVTRVLNSPNNAATAYVTRSGYRSNDNTPLVFKTTNDGATWTNISGDLPTLAINDILVVPGDENTVFIANDAGVYYTTNGGTNWLRLGTDMPFVAVLDIHFNHNQTKLIAGTFGRSMYSIDIQSLTGVVDQMATALSISMYPNPATDVITIQTNKSIKQVSMYNLSGELVKTATTATVAVDDLAAGVYVVEVMQVDGAVMKGKFVKR